MPNLPQPIEESKSLICRHCGAPVPAGQLVCTCFVQRADNELRERKLAEFFDRSGWLYLANGSTVQARRHVLPASQKTTAYCRQFTYKGRPSTIPIHYTPEQMLREKPFWEMMRTNICPVCYTVLKDAEGRFVKK